MKTLELLKKGEEILKDNGIEEYRNDAGLLLEYVTGNTRAYLMAYPETETEKEQEGLFLNHIERRASGYPLQYITGSCCFMGYDIKVDERVLIPRFDTESVAETALELVPVGGRLLDMCTGSGCIAVAAAGSGKGLKVSGCDISAGALELCRENEELNGLKGIEWIRGDLFENVRSRFDMIVSNPPYVTADEMKELPDEVRYEPENALFGGEDGLSFYRRITAESREHLKPGGYLVYETGCFQTEDVSCIMRREGFDIIKVIMDLSGKPRGVAGRLPEDI